MKTIQIKVSIDGVNYLSEIYDAKQRKSINEVIDKTLEEDLAFNFLDTNKNEIYFGSELIKKSIITIIEL